MSAGSYIIPASDLAAMEWPETDDIPAGLSFLQDHLGSFMVGDKVCVAGRTNVGKSHMALCLLSAQARAGVPALYVSLEDPKRRVARRLRCGYTTARLYTAFPPKTTGALLSVFREAHERYGVRTFCVDYFQKVRYDGAAQVWSKPDMLDVALSELEGGIQAAGGMLVLVSQVTRPQPGVDMSEFPKLCEMKESAAIENASEVVLIVGNVKGRPMVEVAKAKDAVTGVRFALLRDPRTGVLSEPMGAPLNGAKDHEDKRSSSDDEW